MADLERMVTGNFHLFHFDARSRWDFVLSPVIEIHRKAKEHPRKSKDPPFDFRRYDKEPNRKSGRCPDDRSDGQGPASPKGYVERNPIGALQFGAPPAEDKKGHVYGKKSDLSA